MSRRVAISIAAVTILVIVSLLVFSSRDLGEGSTKGGSKKSSDASGINGVDSDEDLDGVRSATRVKKRGEVKKIRTQSGLVYQVLAPGKGEKPGPSDRVAVKYRGYLPNGKGFDATPDDETREFGLNQVIKGWSEGLQLMQEGAVYRFIIPPELAYGERAVGGVIEANQTLIFDVELVKIMKVKPRN